MQAPFCTGQQAFRPGEYSPCNTQETYLPCWILPHQGKTPEDAVGALASKTPVNGSFSNVHHALMRAIIHRGTTKQTPTGEISIFCIASNTRGWLASNLRIFLAGQNRLRSELLYPILLAVGNYIS